MPDQPNILLIMTDQQRWDYVGYAGAEFLQTPHLDAIAARGTVFSQCITNSPICAPARIGLATGIHPARIAPDANRSHLPPAATTYYQRLRDAGYIVGCVGKLDLNKGGGRSLGAGDEPLTYAYGFTDPVEIEGKWVAGLRPQAFGPYTNYLEQKGLHAALHNDYVRRNQGNFAAAAYPSVLPEEDFQDTYIGRRAADWLENVAPDSPWHLFVSFAGPHDPMDPPARYAALYDPADMPPAIAPGQEKQPAWLTSFAHRTPNLTKDEIARVRQHYCGSITAIDDAVGRIIGVLAARGWRDDTIVIFTSDHGESLGDHGLYEKQVAYEPSIRVPLAIAGGGLPVGQADCLTELIDLNPTICELAGLPPQPVLDAQSLVPVLSGRVVELRPDTYSMMPHFHCLRTREWKFIDNVNDIAELYPLTEDPREERNVIHQCPAVAARLRQRLAERMPPASPHP